MNEEIYFGELETELLLGFYDRSDDIRKFTVNLYNDILKLEYVLDSKTEKRFKGEFNIISERLNEAYKQFSEVGKQLALLHKYGASDEKRKVA